MVFKGDGGFNGNMKKLIGIGEALIDFIPGETGKSIQQVKAFKPAVGGAPANVCGAFTKLGGKSDFITQLGNDPFGDKIIAEFKAWGIGCEHIVRTHEANTSLAFVALKEDGNREFSFYRNPGADMLLQPDAIKEQWFLDGYGLHFCSVSLQECPMKEAHKRAIAYGKRNNMLISFDPNVRLNLWKDREALKKVILEFLPSANIVKISDEELEFITGTADINKAKEILFQGDVKVIVYTKGAKGAEAYTKKAMASITGTPMNAVDTTGAGDGFIGAFLYQLWRDNVSVERLEALSEEALKTYLEFSDAFSGQSVMKEGAIASYPNQEQMAAYEK